MFNRPVTEGSVVGVAGSGPARADLAPSAPSASVELPAQAVTEAGATHDIQADHHRLTHDAGVIGRVRAAVEGIQRSKKDQEEIEAIRAKLILAYHGLEEEASEAEISPVLGARIEETLVQAELLLGAKTEDARRASANLLKPVEQQDVPAPSVTDKHRVLSKIEDALDRIGMLRDKLGRSERDGYDQLLGLNLSVSGLNSARTLVDDSPYSVSAASTTVENILINVRAAVVAHGRASPDIVRLVLTS
jgi:hypothetical protein